MACKPTMPNLGTPPKVPPAHPDKAMLERWEDDQSVSFDDTSHRSDGLWAFDSINSTTWENALMYMSKTKADVLAVQETRRVSAQTDEAESAARGKGWQMRLSPSSLTEAGNASAGVAMGGRQAHRRVPTPQ